MIFLIFKVFSFFIGCKPSCLLFFFQVFFVLFISLLLLLAINLVQRQLWLRKVRSIISNYYDFLISSLSLIDAGKISCLVINNFKNHLTSLRLITDSLQDPEFFQNKEQFNRYLVMAESLLLKMKKREDLLNRQLNPKQDALLFGLVEEIKSLLTLYQGVLHDNKIKLDFISDKEFRIFAHEDYLLLVINTILLKSIESLILSEQKEKYIKISLTKSESLLKINIENNAVINNFPKSNKLQLKKNCLSQKNITLNFIDAIMSQYFKERIGIKRLKNQNISLSIKIKKSFILAESKLKVRVRM